MKPMNITELVQQQRDFFHTDTTKSVLFRKQALRNLAKWIDRHEHDIYTALKSDLNKSSFESYMTEIGIVKNELRHWNISMNGQDRKECPLLWYNSLLSVLSCRNRLA